MVEIDFWHGSVRSPRNPLRQKLVKILFFLNQPFKTCGDDSKGIQQRMNEETSVQEYLKFGEKSGNLVFELRPLPASPLPAQGRSTSTPGGLQPGTQGSLAPQLPDRGLSSWQELALTQLSCLEVRWSDEQMWGGREQRACLGRGHPSPPQPSPGSGGITAGKESREDPCVLLPLTHLSSFIQFPHSGTWNLSPFI